MKISYKKSGVYRCILILSLSIICGILPFTFPDWSDLLAFQSNYCEYGDINADRIIDISDAVLGLQILSNIKKSLPICIYADVNNDKKIGMEETAYILHKISNE